MAICPIGLVDIKSSITVICSMETMYPICPIDLVGIKLSMNNNPFSEMAWAWCYPLSLIVVPGVCWVGYIPDL